MTENTPKLKGWIIILIIILVLIYLLSFGNADLLTKSVEDRKLKLEEKRKRLDARYNKVQNIIRSKKDLKTKLETLCKRVLFGVRLILALLLVAIILLFYFRFDLSVLIIAEYIGLITFVILVIGFVWVGNPANFFTLWNYFEKKLTLKIYGKYIDIDKKIELHEQELKKINMDKTGLTKEMEEIIQAENEIKEIIEKKGDIRL